MPLTPHPGYRIYHGAHPPAADGPTPVMLIELGLPPSAPSDPLAEIRRQLGWGLIPQARDTND